MTEKELFVVFMQAAITPQDPVGIVQDSDSTAMIAAGIVIRAVAISTLAVEAVNEYYPPEQEPGGNRYPEDDGRPYSPGPHE